MVKNKTKQKELLLRADEFNEGICFNYSKYIPIDIYLEVLEHIRLRKTDVLHNVPCIGVRERSERSKKFWNVGEFIYDEEDDSNDLVVVPISKDREAYFKLMVSNTGEYRSFFDN